VLLASRPGAARIYLCFRPVGNSGKVERKRSPDELRRCSPPSVRSEEEEPMRTTAARNTHLSQKLIPFPLIGPLAPRDRRPLIFA
jgi:hypothetical protein